MQHCEHEDKIGCKWEAEIAINLAKLMNATILCPYRNQIEEIRKIDPNQQIFSVDQAQGSEFENVVLSVGRSNGRGFLNKKRLNVALTRAKNKLFILTHAKVTDNVQELQMIKSILNRQNDVVWI